LTRSYWPLENIVNLKGDKIIITAQNSLNASSRETFLRTVKEMRMVIGQLSIVSRGKWQIKSKEFC